MHTVLLVALKPLILGVFFVLVAGIYKGVDYLIPEGALKRFLFKQRSGPAPGTWFGLCSEERRRERLRKRLLNDWRPSSRP